MQAANDIQRGRAKPTTKITRTDQVDLPSIQAQQLESQRRKMSSLGCQGLALVVR